MDGCQTSTPRPRSRPACEVEQEIESHPELADFFKMATKARRGPQGTRTQEREIECFLWAARQSREADGAADHLWERLHSAMSVMYCNRMINAGRVRSYLLDLQVPYWSTVARAYLHEQLVAIGLTHRPSISTNSDYYSHPTLDRQLIRLSDHAQDRAADIALDFILDRFIPAEQLNEWLESVRELLNPRSRTDTV